MNALHGHANPPSASGVIEGRLIEIGPRALELGINVVIDFDLWARDERSALFAQWAAIISVPTQGELDGSEPPAGFSTWEGWRRQGWPRLDP